MTSLKNDINNYDEEIDEKINILDLKQKKIDQNNLQILQIENKNSIAS